MDNIPDEARAQIEALVKNPNALSERSKVRLWRIAKGMSTSQMGQKLGKESGSSVSAFELNHLGARYIVRSTLEKYIDALGLSTEEFYTTSPLTHPSVGLAARLTLWRIIAGLSIPELAKLSGTTIYMGNKINSNRNDRHFTMDGAVALDMAKALGIPFDILTANAPERRVPEKAPEKAPATPRRSERVVKVATGIKTIPDSGPTLHATIRRVSPTHGFRGHPENIHRNMKKATERANGPAEVAVTERADFRFFSMARVYEAIVTVNTAYGLLGEALEELDRVRQEAVESKRLWDAGPLVPDLADQPTSRR